FAGLIGLAASLALRSRSVAFADRMLAQSSELQQAFASGAMLYSYEFRSLAIFFALVAVGGTLIGLLFATRRSARFEKGDSTSEGGTPSPPPSPRGRGGTVSPEAMALNGSALPRGRPVPPLPEGEGGGEGVSARQVTAPVPGPTPYKKQNWSSHPLRSILAL